MSQYVDLGLLVREPLIFKSPNGKEEYTIPGELNTEFVLKMTKYYKDVTKIDNDEEAFKKMKQLVLDILSLDKSKNIDMKHIEDNFSDFRVMRAVIEHTMKHIQSISEDENLKFPKSSGKKTKTNTKAKAK
ncbi:hypothetical protein GGQ84_001051 [Desulfitispora alkaliphila]|uniref:hypothetical protein n=1 Tax=Desulfitispora alkaliphila TaxID=622674 RepID=UPI003D1B915D